MQKKFISILILITIICSSLLFTNMSAIAMEQHNTIALSPTTDYYSFTNLSDMAVDDESGDLYILQKSIKSLPAKIIKVTKDKQIIELELPLENPQKIYFTNGKIYALDSKKIVSIDNSINIPADISAKDFVVIQDTIYILTEYKVYSIDMQGENSQTIINDLSSASNLVYSNGDLYYIDDSMQSPYKGIFRYSITEKTTKEIKYQGGFPAQNIETNGKYLAISTQKDIQIIDISSQTQKAVLNIDDQANYVGGNIIKADCMTLTIEDKIYIGDSIAKSMHGFSITDALAFDNFYISSSSYENGRFNAPTDIFMQNNKLYILDSSNYRIQTIENNNITIIDLPKKHYNKLVVDTNGNIYVANDSQIYVPNSKKTINSYSNITNLHVSFNSEVYFSSGKNIYQILEDTQRIVFTANENIKAFSFDLKNTTIYYATQSEVVSQSLQDSSIIKKYPLANVLDMDIDFNSSLYLLTSDLKINVIDKTLETITSYSIANISLNSNTLLPLISISALTIDKKNGQLLLCHQSENIISKIDSSIIKAKTEDDIPKLLPTENILDKQTTKEGYKIATIDSWPSTIMYPFHDDYLSNEIYPNDIAITKVTRLLAQNIQVIILEELEDYYYILCQKQVGFILKNKVTIKTPTKPPFEDAVTLHANANIYKLPSTAQNLSGEYIFKCDMLQKSTAIKIVDTVNDFKDSNGVIWYKISYDNGKIGYISRDNATRKPAETQQKTSQGKIKAEISQGVVSIFDSTSKEALPIAKVKDGTSVTIFFEEGDFMYIETTDTSGKTVIGYVLKNSITTNAFTASQIVGMCMIGGTILLIISALVLVKLSKKNKNK